MAAVPTLDFQQAKANHLLFKSRLRSILYTEGDPTDTTVLSQYACAVGRWIYSHALIQYEAIHEVHTLEQVHAQLHLIARDLIRRYEQGYITEARQGLAEMEQVADRLIDLFQLVEEKVNAIESTKEFVSESRNDTTERVDGAQTLTALLAQNELLDSRLRNRTDQISQFNWQPVNSQQVLYNFFMQAPAAFCILRGTQHTFELANPSYQRLIGGRNPVGKSVRQALPELEGQGFYELLDNVYTTHKPYVGRNVSVLLRDALDQIKTIFLDFIYQPTIDEHGKTDGILVFAYEVTEQVVARQQLEKSESKFRSLIEEAPVATGLFVGPSFVIEQANTAMIKMWGRGNEIIGKPIVDALPELSNQAFLRQLHTTFSTGATYYATAEPCKLIVDGQADTYYFDFTYKPLVNELSQIYAVMVMATDVTQQVMIRQKIEDSEAKLRSVITTAPAAMGLYVGRDLVIDLSNQAFIDIVGKGPDIAGKPLRDVMPELSNQPFLQILDDVYTSGKMYRSYGTQVNIVQHGVMSRNFYNITYTPLLNESGNVYAILGIAIDVTDAVVAKQKADEAQESLRGAIELAKLGTWELNLTTGLLNYSARLRQWFGIGSNEIITIERAFEPIQEADRQLVSTSIRQAITPGSDGIFDVEYTVKAAHAGHERILHAQGIAYVNEQGKAYKVGGSVQDITEQRNTELHLAQQVEQRTQELQLSILDLQRSNENLQQFAYIASHDLQEPLRKIQSFSGLLRTEYTEALGNNGLDLLVRLETSGIRMSTLIKDLLSFSRISTRQAPTVPVNLNQLILQVLDNLSLTILENEAAIQVGDLPFVEGDASQLEQLFQNLISNSLKFRLKTDSGRFLAAQVSIHSSLVPESELPATIKPLRMAASYHCIKVSDKGVGFDEKYSDRIFQVFQRLHGKNEFAGTGIGLAICQKVVTNHGGAISVSSKPGQGATFSIYLPI